MREREGERESVCVHVCVCVCTVSCIHYHFTFTAHIHSWLTCIYCYTRDTHRIKENCIFTSKRSTKFCSSASMYVHCILVWILYSSGVCSIKTHTVKHSFRHTPILSYTHSVIYPFRHMPISSYSRSVILTFYTSAPGPEDSGVGLH